ncbi:MAG TPA: beta-N-acetylhexosaminidase [Actinocrinis sp.]|nr:beta-N-acetylhexosaminidase [Actinocrinis sp.]
MTGDHSGQGDSPRGLVPRPQSATRAEGWFELDRETTLHAAPELEHAAAWLRSALSPATGFPLRDGPAGPDNAISFRLAAHDLGAEGYRLSVRPGEVTVEAGGPAGAFYAAQTLRGLLPPAAYRRSAIGGQTWRLPCGTVADTPRFGWRGVMLDVARHFLPKQDVLRFIDLAAMHKLNMLHLHLTDDQGWRIEIRRYPKLTEVGGWRRESPLGDRRRGLADGRPHGGYYTQDDLREIVAYAADRYITVLPEIDVPGHTRAAIAAYPELGNVDLPDCPADPEVATTWGIHDQVLNAEQATVDFLCHVFDEVMDLFPGRWIGVGGDECPTAEWAASPRARARMSELGLTGPDEIRGWYTARLAEHLARNGRTLFGWDEICEVDLPPGAVVASWRGVDGAVTAAGQGHEVVLCPEEQVYLDYRQADGADEPIPVGTVSSLAHVHAFDPVPAALGPEGARHVLGAQSNIWTEHMDSARVIDYMAFPRLCAFAETVWTGPGQDHQGFLRRMGDHEQRLDALGVEYRHPSGPQPWQSRPDAPGWPR